MRLQTKFVVLVIGLGAILSSASFAVLFALHADSVVVRAEAEAQAQAERASRLLEQRVTEFERLVQARLAAAVPAGDEKPRNDADVDVALRNTFAPEAAAAFDFELVRVYRGSDPQTVVHTVNVGAHDKREHTGGGDADTFDEAVWTAVHEAVMSRERRAGDTGVCRVGDALYEAVIVAVPGSTDNESEGAAAYVFVGRKVGNTSRHEPLADVVLGGTGDQRGTVELLTLADAFERGLTGEPGEDWEAGSLYGTLPATDHGEHDVPAVLVRQLGSDEPLLLAVHADQSTRPLLMEVMMMTAALVFGGLLLMAATIVGLHVLVVRRLQRLARYAERVRSPGDLGRRPVEDTGNDEIGQLYHSVEMMLDRIEDQANALRLTNEELMSALHAKDEFFHATSHELRTPLATISGFLERLEQQLGARAAASGTDNGSGARNTATGEASHAVGEIKQAAYHLLHLIDEMLELSRARAGKLPFEMGPVDVLEVLEDVRGLTASQAEGKALELEFAEPAQEISAVRADHRRLVQVLLNLVGNAIKYTGEMGRVEVQVEEVVKAHHVCIHVRDNGPGIEAEQQARLFEPFFRVSTCGNEPGVGLGLAIVRDFVERMNGHMAVASEPGKGSRFTVSLPLFAAWEEGLRPSYDAVTTSARAASASAKPTNA